MLELTEDQQLYLADLRSGRIDQARDTLREDDAMCCLGVACERFRLETGLGVWNNPEDGGTVEFFLLTYVEDAVMPPPVAHWLGLNAATDKDPILIVGDFLEPRSKTWLSLPATSLNDDYRMDFIEIAFYFEHLFRTGRPYKIETREEFDTLMSRAVR